MVHIWTQGDMILEVATRPICFLPSNPTFEYKIYQHSEIIQYPKNERFIKSLIKVRKFIEVTGRLLKLPEVFIEVTRILLKLPEVYGSYRKLLDVTGSCRKLS